MVSSDAHANAASPGALRSYAHEKPATWGVGRWVGGYRGGWGPEVRELGEGRVSCN